MSWWDANTQHARDSKDGMLDESKSEGNHSNLVAQYWGIWALLAARPVSFAVRKRGLVHDA
ncbi:hypothetical protein SAMN02745181_3318 [Rubritalea squalenifaciens DSM 18772]|uniref:Uncharacterized protein n=1 Tax=Rubritalea squalenifaciens DSM 18772 TaxID=1123071 RepID=A0A1M6PVZ4_9BACT|nr:hypothetical protein SAMN02745181_3318 [Rubritalea squalenifaciens DSM 18772]